MEKSSFDALADVLRILQRLKIPYMVVGSFSCNAYAMPRSTKDADIVDELEADDLNRIQDELSSDFYMNRQLSFETITNSVRNVLTFRPTSFDIELFRLNRDDPHHQSRFQRRRTETIAEANLKADIPTAEDVIIQKLRWQRDKDISDARNVIQAQLPQLDWNYLHHWTDQHGTTDLLNQLRTEAE